MMQFLYNTAINIFTTGIRIASLFQPKAHKAIQGRKNWKKDLKNKLDNNAPWIWMHCSSLGEFEQGRPIFDRLKDVFPNHKLALSFFSPSGYEIRKNYPKADVVFYLPFDSKQNAQILAQFFKPEYLILVKYDYWFNHLQAQKSVGTKIIVVSAIFRSNQMYFNVLGKWSANKLKHTVEHFFVQDHPSKTLLKTIGIESVTVSGDTRFDRVRTIAESTDPLDWVEAFKGDNNLCVVGSSWPKDEELWVTYIKNHAPSDWKFIIAPHEIGEQHIAQLRKQLNDKVLLYSELNQNTTFECNVMILNAIGLLSHVYASADLAYVGGGFKSSGVHNTLEPAVFGTPVIIGPNYQKFNEVKMLKSENIVFPISSYDEFEETLIELMKNEEKRHEIQVRAKEVFQNQLPSTEIIINYLRQNMNV